MTGPQIGEVPDQFVDRVMRIFQRRGDGESFAILEKAEQDPALYRFAAVVDQPQLPPGLCRRAGRGNLLLAS